MATNNSINVATGASGTVLTGAGVGSAPVFSGTPTLTSVAFNPTTGGVVGTTTNDNASAGYVGEFVSSVIPAASAITLTNDTNVDVTSISLTAGDWDVWGNVTMVSKGTAANALFVWVSSTSATVPDASLYGGISMIAAGSLENGTAFSAPQLRFSLSGTTTIYLTAYKGGTDNGTACGGIYARRAR